MFLSSVVSSERIQLVHEIEVFLSHELCPYELQCFISHILHQTSMSQAENLRCNICGLALTSLEAKTHSSTSSHTSLKRKLEQELESVRKGQYANDRSVILQWENSI